MHRILLLLACCLLAACAQLPRVGGDAAPAEYIIVRHAEKVADGSDDPVLTAAGRIRAEVLAASLVDTSLAAVYSTDYRRTRQTAAPTADAHGLAVTIYDARQPAADFVARLRRAHPAGTVLVVGHSNTVPDIAAALCDCTVAAMDESEYDRVVRVRIAADGSAALTTTHAR